MWTKVFRENKEYSLNDCKGFSVRWITKFFLLKSFFCLTKDPLRRYFPDTCRAIVCSGPMYNNIQQIADSIVRCGGLPRCRHTWWSTSGCQRSSTTAEIRLYEHGDADEQRTTCSSVWVFKMFYSVGAQAYQTRNNRLGFLNEVTKLEPSAWLMLPWGMYTRGG